VGRRGREEEVGSMKKMDRHDGESRQRGRQYGRFHRPWGRLAVCGAGGCLSQRKHRILAVLFSFFFSFNLCDSLAVRPLPFSPRLGQQLQLKIGVRMCEAVRGEGFKTKKVAVVGGGVGGRGFPPGSFFEAPPSHMRRTPEILRKQ